GKACNSYSTSEYPFLNLTGPELYIGRVKGVNMPLKIGDWQMNESGVSKKLTITAIDPDGVVSGSIDGIRETLGLWDETSQMISFIGGERSYKGFLFGTAAPRSERAFDVGRVQINKLDDAVSIGGNASRNGFAWFAQITDVGPLDVTLSDFTFL